MINTFRNYILLKIPEKKHNVIILKSDHYSVSYRWTDTALQILSVNRNLARRKDIFDTTKLDTKNRL